MKKGDFQKDIRSCWFPTCVMYEGISLTFPTEELHQFDDYLKHVAQVNFFPQNSKAYVPILALRRLFQWYYTQYHWNNL